MKTLDSRLFWIKLGSYCVTKVTKSSKLSSVDNVPSHHSGAQGRDFAGRKRSGGSGAVAGGWCSPDQEIPGSPNRDPDSRFPADRETARFPIPDSRPIGNRESGNPPQNRENGGSDSRFPSDVRASTAVNSDKAWVDIVRKVRPIVRHLRVRVVILHRPVLGS